MAIVPNGVETLRKISTDWVGRTNVTDDRQTDIRETDGRQHIANVNVSSRSLKTTYYFKQNQIFYLDVSISTRPSSEEDCSVLLPVLATIEMWRGKKSVVHVAQPQRIAGLVQGSASFFSEYCFSGLSSTFVRFSVQNCTGRPIDHVMIIMRSVVSQYWFVLLRRTWCTLVSGKRFTSYGLHLRHMFFQSCAKFSSSLSYVTILDLCENITLSTKPKVHNILHCR